MIDEQFVIIGGVVVFLGSVGYIRDTLAGRVSPNRISWLLWAVAPLIAFSAQLSQGVGLPALMTFAVGFGPLLIFLASLRHGSWQLSRLDIVCGAISIVGLVLWQLSGEGSVAIALSIIADAMAAVPTIVKSYRQPHTESWQVYFLWTVSAGITFLTLDTWTFTSYGFPLYIFSLGLLLSFLVKSKVGVRSKAKGVPIYQGSVDG